MQRDFLITGLVVLLSGLGLAQNLQQTPFSDGTGSIGLPAGWQITNNYRGSVTCSNGNGATVILGLPWAIIPSGSSLTSLPAAQQSPIAPIGDVFTAFNEVLAKKARVQLLSLRSRPAPPAFAGVPAYYLMYETNRNGVRYTAIGYFTSLIYGSAEPWQLYSSAIIAPTQSFVKMYPTLMRIWRSWQPNGQEPIAGSQSAKLDEILRDRQNRMDLIQEAFRRNL